MALSKVDRVRAGAASEDEVAELIELASEDVRATLAGGPFADAPIIPVSAHTGEGMDELRAALLQLAQTHHFDQFVDTLALGTNRIRIVRRSRSVLNSRISLLCHFSWS